MVLSSVVLAGEADEAFESLFGSEFAQVKRTSDTADDVAVAAKLLTAASVRGVNAALVAVLCDKAYELAAPVPSGYETAARAMILLSQQWPERRADCREKILALRTKQFAAARPNVKAEAGEALIDAQLAAADLKSQADDDTEAANLLRAAQRTASAIRSPRERQVTFAIERLAQRSKARQQAAALKAALDAAPQGQATREKLVLLYLVELDDPARAATYLDTSCDPQLQKYVPAAAMGPDAAPEAACLELAEWYRRLSDKADVRCKVNPLVRGYEYYDRYLSLHTTNDVSRSTAQLALKKVEAALAELGDKGASPGIPGPWIEVLPLMDPVRNAVAGKWLRRPDGVVEARGAGGVRAFIPRPIEGSYEVRVAFVRMEGEFDVRVILPVGTSGVAVCLGAGGDSSYLGNIAEAANSSESHASGRLKNGQDYAIAAQVRLIGDKADITVLLDGERLLHWAGPQSALSVPASVALPQPKCLGMGGHYTTIAFKSVKVRKLPDKAGPPK